MNEEQAKELVNKTIRTLDAAIQAMVIQQSYINDFETLVSKYRVELPLEFMFELSVIKQKAERKADDIDKSVSKVREGAQTAAGIGRPINRG